MTDLDLARLGMEGNLPNASIDHGEPQVAQVLFQPFPNAGVDLIQRLRQPAAAQAEQFERRLQAGEVSRWCGADFVELGR